MTKGKLAELKNRMTKHCVVANTAVVVVTAEELHQLLLIADPPNLKSIIGQASLVEGDEDCEHCAHFSDLLRCYSEDTSALKATIARLRVELENIKRAASMPIFDVPYNKLYNADGIDEGVILTPEETSNLMYYIQHMMWLTNPPEELWDKLLGGKEKTRTKSTSFLSRLFARFFK